VAQSRPGSSLTQSVLLLAFITLAALASTGCEIDSFLDPSMVGRWERTPVYMPILKRLDLIEGPESKLQGLTTVQPEDLIPQYTEYVIGPGDLITVTIFELIVPGVDSVTTRRVDELGQMRIPVLGTIKVSDYTARELEEVLIERLDDEQILKDAQVSVIIQEGRQNTFSLLGQGGGGGAARVGTYNILRSDFRLLDAVSLVGGIPGRINKLYILRQTDIAPRTVIPEDMRDEDEGPGIPGIDDLSEQMGAAPEEDVSTVEPGEAAPAPLEHGLDESEDVASMTQWVNVGGEWRQIETGTMRTSAGVEEKTEREAKAAEDAEREANVAEVYALRQRIIEVPYQRLLEGDMRYNIVIRPGDIIRVPPAVAGNVYLGGEVGRPGTFALPGGEEMTFTQLMLSSGGFSPLAVPERIDLIRRVGDHQQAYYRFNGRSIFKGEAPDFYLKPNDTLMVGTSMPASLLAVIRNGFRVSFGFGFVFDRNFSDSGDDDN